LAVIVSGKSSFSTEYFSVLKRSYRSSPSSQICKNLDWPMHRVLAHGSILGKSASGSCSIAGFAHFACFIYLMIAMVGDRLVSACGWEGGATMRSVPVAVNTNTAFSLIYTLILLFRVAALIPRQCFIIP